DGSPLQSFAGPIAEVGVLAEDPAQLLFGAAGDGPHDLVDSAPAQPQRAPLRGPERSAGHEDGGPAQVVVVKSAEIRAQDSRLLQGRRGGADSRASTCEILHTVRYRRVRCAGARTWRSS